MIKIALIHPSYKRYQMALGIFKEWVSAADHPEQVEYLVGLDENDTTAAQYNGLHDTEEAKKLGRLQISVGDSTSSVTASLRCCKLISDTTELLFQISDDTAPIPHWDTVLLDLLKDVDNFKEIKAIAVADGYWAFGTVFVHPIINRALYNKLGYLVYPEYTSMFADNDFTGVCRKLGCFIEAPQLTFQHRHYTKGLNAFDETYARRNNDGEFKYNERIYNERVARGFDLE